MESLFENWKPRASSLGYLLSNLPQKITPEETQKLQDLLDEKLTGVNANGNKTKWTDAKQTDVDKLHHKKKGLDILPDGAITKLEEIFNAVFWKRKKILNNKYLEKGNINEEDSLELKSQVDGVSYWKNDEFFDNGFVCGTPDNITDKVRDIKSNFEFDTFKRAELTSLYAWQIKAYLWLTNLKNGELVYALTNSPPHRIEAERKSMWFAMGQPEHQEERWIIACSQLEMNHIFDIDKFKSEFPNFDLANTLWRNIPKHIRIKCFEVTLQDQDIEHMKRRSQMCKDWLLEREQQELELINSKKF